MRRASAFGHQIESGDRVLIQHGNSCEFFADLLAVWTLGACAIPVDGRLTPFEIGRIVAATGAHFTLVRSPKQVETASRGISVMDTNDAGHAEIDAFRISRGRYDLDDPALILFTSGSTGDPKGVVHTHRSLLSRWTALQSCVPAEACARTLCLLPTSFGHGLICNSLFPWLSGHHVFVCESFRPEILADLGRVIDEWEITFLSSVPSLWSLVLRAAGPPRKSTLRRVHVGSAPLSAALWRQVQEWTQIEQVFNAYGITEVGSWIAGLSDASVVPEDGLIGKPCGTTFRISPARQTQEFSHVPQCHAGEEGMIWVNTPGLMKGYYQRDDFTKAAVVNGWFKTGDIGTLDSKGRLFIKGREREEINKGGLKIFPTDVDLVAEACVGVTETCTFAVEDLHYGENVAIAVVLDNDDSEGLRRLRELLAAQLAPHKHPVKWYRLRSLPRNDRGKIERRLVSELCAQLQPLDLNVLTETGRYEEVDANTGYRRPAS